MFEASKKDQLSSIKENSFVSRLNNFVTGHQLLTPATLSKELFFGDSYMLSIYSIRNIDDRGYSFHLNYERGKLF